MPISGLRRLTSEDVLTLAEEVCAATGDAVRSPAALCAVAAVTDASIGGIAVHRNRAEARAAVDDVVVKLGPLRERNDLFAAVVWAAMTA